MKLLIQRLDGCRVLLLCTGGLYRGEPSAQTRGALVLIFPPETPATAQAMLLGDSAKTEPLPYLSFKMLMAPPSLRVIFPMPAMRTPSTLIITSEATTEYKAYKSQSKNYFHNPSHK